MLSDKRCVLSSPQVDPRSPVMDVLHPGRFMSTAMAVSPLQGFLSSWFFSGKIPLGEFSFVYSAMTIPDPPPHPPNSAWVLIKCSKDKATLSCYMWYLTVATLVSNYVFSF